MNNEQDYAIVYVLSNKAMPEFVKIGVTRKEDINIRMKELYNTSVPLPFTCEYACKVPINMCTQIEKALHKAFERDRVNPKREYFTTKVEYIKPILEVIDSDKKDITSEFITHMEEDIDATELQAVQNFRKRRPSINFEEMNIPQGATLIFKKDPQITVQVVGKNKVLFNNKETTLSPLTTDLLGKDKANYGVQPALFWLYNGRLLSEIYNEIYPIEI